MINTDIFKYTGKPPKILDTDFGDVKLIRKRHAGSNVPHKWKYHSPTGFEWGYGGSGPSDLALNILGIFLDPYWAYKWHQEFKRWFIEGIPHEGGTIPKVQIIAWIEKKINEEEIHDITEYEKRTAKKKWW